MGSINKLEVSYLRRILANDPYKQLKLWDQLTWRLIVLNYEKLPMFKGLMEDKIKLFSKMCQVALYSGGETVKMSAGGIIF